LNGPGSCLVVESAPRTSSMRRHSLAKGVLCVPPPVR
jgi:hypothetical protein